MTSSFSRCRWCFASSALHRASERAIQARQIQHGKLNQAPVSQSPSNLLAKHPKSDLLMRPRPPKPKSTLQLQHDEQRFQVCPEDAFEFLHSSALMYRVSASFKAAVLNWWVVEQFVNNGSLAIPRKRCSSVIYWKSTKTLPISIVLRCIWQFFVAFWCFFDTFGFFLPSVRFLVEFLKIVDIFFFDKFWHFWSLFCHFLLHLFCIFITKAYSIIINEKINQQLKCNVRNISFICVLAHHLAVIVGPDTTADENHCLKKKNWLIFASFWEAASVIVRCLTDLFGLMSCLMGFMWQDIQKCAVESGFHLWKLGCCKLVESSITTAVF